MTTSERLSAVEDTQVRILGLVELVTTWIAEDRQHIRKNDAILEEVRRENRQTRRTWIAIARKQKLFDDDEFQDVFGKE